MPLPNDILAARAILERNSESVRMPMHRLNLFRDTTAAEVDAALVAFYRERSRPLREQGQDWERMDVHQDDNGWVAVNLGLAWDWKESRKAQLQVSRQLGRAGFLVFVNDDASWGYEFFESGRTLDHFVRRKGTVPAGFPAKGCAGNAETIAVRLPFVDHKAVAACLVQEESGEALPRGESRGAADFLAALGVSLEGEAPRSPVHRSMFKKQ